MTQNVGSRFDIATGKLISWFGWAGIASGTLLSAYGVVIWLREGTWSFMRLSEGLHRAKLTYPHVDWIGIQKIIDFTLRLPLAIGLIFGGFLVVWCGDIYEQESRQKAVSQRSAPINPGSYK